MQSGRNVAVVIAVADSVPRRYLAGALNGAAAFAAWAEAMAYDTYSVTDDVEPVTFKRLEDELLRALDPAQGRIYRLLLYFAGHGLIRDAEEGLWLLSDSNRKLRAVASEPLRRRLYAWDIQQISIFADACRDLPSSMATLQLTPDPVLGRGPNQLVDAVPPVAKFIATQDGQAAYALPGQTPAEDRCLFSGVLIEGLWALKPAALSPQLPGKVTSDSLADFLRHEVPQVATRYSCRLNPMLQAYLPGGENIYFDTASAPSPPAFAPWPDPASVTASALSVGDPGEPFVRNSTQGLIVGATLFCFIAGVEPEVREAISDVALLAHLVANQASQAGTDPASWLDAYQQCVSNLGWAAQQSIRADWARQATAGMTGDRLAALLESSFSVAAGSIASITRMLALVRPNAPWAALLHRESRLADTARCQIALLENDGSGALSIYLASCIARALTGTADVLSTDTAAMQGEARATKFRCDTAMLISLRPAIRIKIRAFEAAYVSSVRNL